MIYGDISEFLSTFVDYEELNELFDYERINDNLPETYKKELHKFNHLYKSFFFNEDRLVFMINNYEIVLKKAEIVHLMKLYLHYKEYDKNNSYLIAEFLLSYYNTIRSKKYADNVSDVTKIRKDFNDALREFPEVKNPILIFCNDAFELYNLIIDYGVKKQDFFLGDIINRACSNFRFQKDKKQQIIKKLLKNQVYQLQVIEYDDEIEKNSSYYKKYIKSSIYTKNYYRYPEKIIYELDKKNKLGKNLLDMIIDQIVEKINEIQEKSLNINTSFIQLLGEIDDVIKIVNSFLNKIKNINKKQLKKLHECIINILYIKRMIVSDDEKIKSEMQEFKYDTVIPNKKIDEFVELLNNNIGLVYTVSCGNFTKRLEDSLNTYAKYPISYIFNSFNIDSEKQVYSKSDDKVENTIFKEYYD